MVQLTAEQKVEKKAQHKEFILTKSVKEIAAIGNSRSHEDTLAFFSIFDSMDDLTEMNKELPMEKLAEVQALWTPEAIEHMKGAIDSLFGDRREWSKKMAAEWLNTAPEDQLKAVLSKKTKLNHMEFYKIFENKEQYQEWLDAMLTPERRNARHDCFTEEQRADDKVAFEEIFGSGNAVKLVQLTAEQKAEKKKKYKEMILTKSVEEIAAIGNNRSRDETLDAFSCFDSMDDLTEFNKELPMEKLAEVHALWTPEALEVMKGAVDSLFGDRRECSKRRMAEWFNTAPEDQLNAVLSKKTKLNHMEFYKIFENKEQYHEWLDAMLTPERRNARHDCFTEDQRADDKLAFEEIFGSA